MKKSMTPKMPISASDYPEPIVFIINGREYHFKNWQLEFRTESQRLVTSLAEAQLLYLDAEDDDLIYHWVFAQYEILEWRDFEYLWGKRYFYEFRAIKNAPICAAVVEHKWKAIKVWINNTGPFNGQIFPTT